MKEFKGTKGEWVLRISGYRDYIAIDGGRQANSDNRSIMYKQFNPTETPTKQQSDYYNEWKANAQLISAAPDLFEALQKSNEQIELVLKANPEYEGLSKTINSNNAAINKALGL